ncbi:MAG: TonB-dependent receptor [Nitrospiria bacterium]
MKNRPVAYLQTVFILILSTAGNPAFAKSRLDLDLGVGYRVDHLDWNIAGVINGNPVNIVSELTWDDVRIQQVRGGGRLIVENVKSPMAFYMRGTFGYGQIMEGENQDSDFLGNNRTLEFSRSNNDADAGEALDASVGFGYQFKKRFRASRMVLRLAPVVGYSYHEQHFTMTKGFQTIVTPFLTPPLGPFPGLNSAYETEWKGPWVGLDLTLNTGKKLSVFGRIEYHLVDYFAEADWNLRPDFAHPVSFTHAADGSGLLASAGWSYQLRPAWTFFVDLQYLDWSTDRGTDVTFLSQAEIDRLASIGIVTDGVILIPLNEVNWESQSLTLGIVYRFH